MARSVHVEYAYKVNMGDFESLEIRYGVTEEGRPDEKMNDLFKRVDDYVSKKVFDEVEAVKERVHGRK
jgi:hypothetical protein